MPDRPKPPAQAGGDSGNAPESAGSDTYASATAGVPAGAPAGALAGAPVRSLFKRPESVLVVVYTADLDVLLISRRKPEGFWQSVTGSLESGETPAQAAARELAEETGIVASVNDHAISRSFPIAAAWRRRYAPGVTENLEHEFSVQLPERCEVVLDPTEHVEYCWLPIVEAMAKVSSRTNRAALQAILKAEG